MRENVTRNRIWVSQDQTFNRRWINRLWVTVMLKVARLSLLHVEITATFICQILTYCVHMCPRVGDLFVLKIISALVFILFAEMFFCSYSTLVSEIIFGAHFRFPFAILNSQKTVNSKYVKLPSSKVTTCTTEFTAGAFQTDALTPLSTDWQSTGIVCTKFNDTYANTFRSFSRFRSRKHHWCTQH